MKALRFLVFGRVVLVIAMMGRVVQSSQPDVAVSYILEPFENVDPTPFETKALPYGGTLVLSTVSSRHALFGDHALRVEYQRWNNNVNTTASTTPDVISVGRIEDPKVSYPHNCWGTTHLSLHYAVPSNLPDRLYQLRLVLANDDSSGDEILFDSSTVTIMGSPMTEDDLDWNELQFPVASFQEKGNIGSPTSSGNRNLDLSKLRGWWLEMTVVESASTGNGDKSDKITVFFDQLQCVGGGSLVGAAFHPSYGLPQAIEDGTWNPQYFQSPLSESKTNVVLQNGRFDIDYTVQQTESWGGFLSFRHMAPGQGYYNLSQATSIQLNYDVKVPTSVRERLHLRLILLDSSDCMEDCQVHQNVEHYYSFFYVLDEVANGTLTVELSGDKDSDSPFWRTGWNGMVGNNVLDPAHVKGFVLELSVNSDGELQSTVSGHVVLDGLTATNDSPIDENTSEQGGDRPWQCAVEKGLILNTSSPVFTRVEFMATDECCNRCASDDECYYAFSDKRDCYIASYLEPTSFGLTNSGVEQDKITTLWKTNPVARGDFCDICSCQGDTIDCRGRDLVTVPVLGSQTDPFRPRILDLRNNPRLGLIGTGAFESIGATIEELRLPANIGFLAYNSFANWNRLVSVQFEGDESDRPMGNKNLQNIVTGPFDSFGHVCCTPGATLSLDSSPTVLDFCEMKVETPGIDSVYNPFVEIVSNDLLLELTPSSPFLSEAAESVEKCAEVCTISADCSFFSYDARVTESEHRCYLRRTNGTSSHISCCEDGHYADDDKTLPGWTSGHVPRTRHKFDNARVIISPSNVVAQKSNQYTVQYQVSLGSMPLRGSVWIEPRLVSETTLDVVISPRRVILYDNATTALVTVRAPNAETEQILVIANLIESCDVAFMESKGSENNVLVNVVLSEDADSLLIALLASLGALLVILTLAVYCYTEYKKRQADLVWTVDPAELHFDNPPLLLGRGTFGSVMKAEYRGTEVAVKRVLPAKQPTPPEQHCTTEEDIEAGLSQKDSIGMRTVNPGMKSCSGNKSAYRNKRMLRMMSGHSDDYSRLKGDFMAEMRDLSKLRHPCITTVMGAVVTGEPMLVMELMHHGSLYDMLHNETIPIEGELLLPILRDITHGIRFLHAATPQIIHGDLKAQNVLVDSRYRAKVADFGLTQKKRLGATGTPFWMAPELLRGESQNTAASDIYSFGIVLFEVYSRQDPYDGEDGEQVLLQVADKSINKRPPAPAACPPKLQRMMMECLDGNPERRPSFQEIDLQLKRMDVSTVEPGLSPQLKSRKTAAELLFEVFPQHVAEALRQGRKVEAESRDVVTIFFSDIVGFTEISSTMSPMQVSQMLGSLYEKFDELSQKHDVFKVETIGDAYMAVTNLIKDQPDHAKRIAAFAVDAIKAANKTLLDKSNPDRGHVNIRVGFHSGPVVADVVGTRNPRYCLFGDAVNVASRMESLSLPNHIHCSERAAQLLKQQDPSRYMHPRGLVEVKGKGRIKTYWVDKVPDRHVSSVANSSQQDADPLAADNLMGDVMNRLVRSRSIRW